MADSICENCGGEYQWDWTEAFSMHGFRDGDAQVETWQVELTLKVAGYTAIVSDGGMYNAIITSIKKDGKELMPLSNKDYELGISDPRVYFPKEIVDLLDLHFPRSK